MPNDDRSDTAHGTLLYRLAPALATVLVPMAVAAWVIDTTYRLFPRGEWPTIEPDYFVSATYERLAHDLEGRLLYGTLSGFGRAVALASVAFALFVLIRTFGTRLGSGIWAVATMGGAAYGCHDALAGMLRPKILDAGLEVAESIGLIGEEAVTQVRSTILVNTVVGFAGTMALLAGFAAVAWRSDPAKDAEFGADRLRQRLRDLQFLALLGAAILVLLVLVNKVQLGWLQSLLNPDPAKSFGVIASATANFWGASATATLICVLIPATSRRAKAATTTIRRKSNGRRTTRWSSRLLQ